jgi:cell division protein FtsL
MRLLNIMVIGVLILAASFVYKIKFDSTLQAERVGKLAGELRRERNAIAALRAEWAKLDTPGRIQGLADRHLALQPILPTQFDNLDRLPDRPPVVVQPPSDDPIGAMLEPTAPDTTGSVAAPKAAR